MKFVLRKQKEHKVVEHMLNMVCVCIHTDLKLYALKIRTKPGIMGPVFNISTQKKGKGRPL